MKSSIFALTVVVALLTGCGSKEERAEELSQVEQPPGAVVSISLSICGMPYLNIGTGCPLWIEATVINPMVDGDLDLSPFSDSVPTLVALDGSDSVALSPVKPWPLVLPSSVSAQAIWRVEEPMMPGEYRVNFRTPEPEDSRIHRIKVQTCRISIEPTPASERTIAQLNRRFQLLVEGPGSVVESVEALANADPENMGVQFELAGLYRQLSRHEDELRVLVHSAYQLAGKEPGEMLPIQALPCWMPGRIRDAVDGLENSAK